MSNFKKNCQNKIYYIEYIMKHILKEKKIMLIDPVMISLLPLLFIVLIFLTYLNVVESKRTRNIDEKMGIMANYMKIVADKLSETPEKQEKTTD